MAEVYKHSDEAHSDDSDCNDDSYLPIRQWYAAITRYSERSLTYSIDKLPVAAEGLARDIVSKGNVGRYLAGIWEYDLALGLLWRSSNSEITRPEAYRAPSWSWASLNTFTTWPPFPYHEYEVVPSWVYELLNGDIELQDFDLQFESQSNFSRVSGGHLVLKAKFRRVLISGPHRQEDIRLPRYGDTSRALISMLSDFEYSIHDGAELLAYAVFDMKIAPSSRDAVALRIVNQPPECSAKGLRSGLILQPSEATPAPGSFVRVGLFVLSEDHLNAFDNVQPASIAVV